MYRFRREKQFLISKEFSLEIALTSFFKRKREKKKEFSFRSYYLEVFKRKLLYIYVHTSFFFSRFVSQGSDYDTF